jgi:voltage-gated potassium channel
VNTAELRERIHEIIFEAETPAGRAFDVGLLIAILISIAVVMLDSVGSVHARFGSWLVAAEWTLTVLFSIEYVLRLVSVHRPLAYAFSFFGAVDLLSIAPTYLSLLFSGAQSLIVIRSLRLLRAFRVLKLAHLLGEANILWTALQASRPKIAVFLVSVGCAVTIVGAFMYLVEGPEHGFTSIPVAIYWAIVTITTVGYGDIHPQTPLGQAIASAAMVLGYGIIAVPTGIVSVELAEATRTRVNTVACPACAEQGHDLNARYCKRCGAPLRPTLNGS